MIYKSTVKYKYIFLLLILCIFFASPIFAQTAGNDVWYRNACWYQIFPDRFYKADIGINTAITDRYDKNGNPIYVELSPWSKINPTWYDKYGGNIKGITEKIPYLKALGINAIWLNPIFLSTSNHRYNTGDYAKIDPLLGTENDFKELVKQLHKNGIKIILDGVFNHTGYEFWAFQDIVNSGEKSKYKNWYTIKSYPVIKLWEQTEKNKPNYECWWDIGSLPKLSFTDPKLKKYIFSITKKWMDIGIDGWRLDVPNEIRDPNFWAQWSSFVKKCKPDVIMVGEIWDNASIWVNNGDKFNSVMNYYAFREPVLKFFSGGKLKVSEFDRLLKERRSNYSHQTNCAMLNLLDSHDTARIVSSVYNKDASDKDKEKKVYYNGPVDEVAYSKLKIIYFFQFTYVGSPIIYYGDEVGMVGGNDPDCRRPFIWDKQKQNKDLLEWIKKLTYIRNNNKPLRTGAFTTLLCDDKNNVYGYMREGNGEKIIIILNYSDKEAAVAIPVGDKLTKNQVVDLISGKKINISGKNLTLKLKPYSGVILK